MQDEDDAGDERAAVARCSGRQASLQRLDCRTGAPRGVVMREERLVELAAELGVAWLDRHLGPRVPRPRVEDAVEDVDDEVRDDDDQRQQHGQAHHDRVVAGA